MSASSNFNTQQCHPIYSYSEYERCELKLSNEILEELQLSDGSFSTLTINDIESITKYHGCSPNCRLFLWRCFLHIFEFTDTSIIRENKLKQQEKDYYQLKSSWFMVDQPETAFTDEYHKHIDIICKDVQRTDRDEVKFKDLTSKNVQVLVNVLLTYAVNSPCGYGQGMSDIVSVIMEITTIEHEVYWLFEKIVGLVSDVYGDGGMINSDKMKIVGTIISVVDEPFAEYFTEHGFGFEFLVRWFLTLFKREFRSNEILVIWDAIFADGDVDFIYYLASSIILKHKDVVISFDSFDQLFVWCVGLENQIPLQAIFDADAVKRKYNQYSNKEYK
ncbi:Rab-GAP TBC domain-containing protein [Entamoeba marina]